VRIVLLCFAAAHSQDVALLGYQFDSHGDQVCRVSIKNRDWTVEWEVERSELYYFVLQQRICKILRSLIADFIRTEIKCGDCLQKIANEWSNGKYRDTNSVTLFCNSAFARYCAPWSPIPFAPRSSAVIVCKK
jgi:hypothetical protein